jgi:PD-(D/E)XK nuclease superfamily
MRRRSENCVAELVAFSFSRLEGYETCPKKFFHLSVAKDWKDPPNEMTQYGTDLHKAFADFLKSGKMLPLHLRQHLPMLRQLQQAPGEKVIEQQIAINHEYKQTDWFAKDTYCRVISDLTIMNGPHAVMFDWKSGKLKDGFDQLRLAAAVMFLIAEELETISMHYVWTKNKAITSDKMARADMPDVWANLMPRLQHYQNAHANMDFPARQGFHCNYCPIKTCPYNSNKRLGK